MNLKGITGASAALGLMAGLGLAPGTAHAAERIVLTYGSLAMTIPVEELDALATTGAASPELNSLLDLAGQDPETLRTALNSPVSINPLAANILLNTPPGERLLDLVGEAVQPTSGAEGSRSALRSALVASAADGEVSLLEVLRVYPSPDIVVQGDRLMDTYGQVFDLIGPWIELGRNL
jgi:hypothetical protein